MKPSHTLTDEELVEQARNGSEAHFEALVDRYTTHVYRLAYGITAAHQEAEDVVQETFLKVYKHLDRFSPSKASFKTWLLAIARNQSINVFASLKRKALRMVSEKDSNDDSSSYLDTAWSPDQPDPENQLSLRQQQARVHEALKELPERQRTALLLKAQENLSYEEISTVMKTSVSSVESLIFRGRKRLLEIMEK